MRLVFLGIGVSVLVSCFPWVRAGCAGVWSQCGGVSFSGPTCCVAGATCQYSNDWYSQCLPTTSRASVSPTASPTDSPTASPTVSPTYGTVSVLPSNGGSNCQPGDLVGSPLTNVKGTYWSESTDQGGCALPKVAYNVQHALSIGDMTVFQSLFPNNYQGSCGKVVRLNCGGSEVDAIVTSSCDVGSLSCGLDMIAKTWNATTGGQPYGVASCTMSLTCSYPMGGTTPKCFLRPDAISGSSAYYTSLGVFNTGAKILKSISVAGVEGKSNGVSNAYFDFNASGQPLFVSNSQVVVTYQDGSTSIMTFGDCQQVPEVMVWQ
eukprot:TRINITY_DN6220_c0_g1_i1.p1 TRINITY_DN6220_c0_g1~~TRINITY_DN6220_c0_g1_i1.p1  ORF type:complete len:320 (+),score=50.36 TRINITY_DN6220_c0_g1_i1:236-1195(+)